MARSSRRLWRYPLVAGAVLVMVGVGVVSVPWCKQYLLSDPTSPDKAASTPAMQLVSSEPGTLRLEPQVVRRLKIEVVPVQSSTTPVAMELFGTLGLDTGRLSRVHARFAGEVVELGQIGPEPQSLDIGDQVRKGQLLAVVWSRDLGEKKSELIDNLSQLRIDQESLDRLTKVSIQGAIPEHTLRDAQRKVESGRIAVERVVRTLETWRVTPEEIDALRAEAQRLASLSDRPRRDKDMVQQWARCEVRAPMDGTVLERNIAMGDLVDTNLDLFKIADLTRLRVMAQAYEETLPSLDSLAGGQRQWTIRVEADPEALPRAGQFDQISRLIDPNQHTATVMGWVDNKDLRLRAGQFITARVELMPGPDEAAIPASAVVDRGDEHFVFVQPDADDPRFTQRKVAVVRRNATTVFVRTQPTSAESHQGIQPLRVGERVVSSGALQLLAGLNQLQTDRTASN